MGPLQMGPLQARRERKILRPDVSALKPWMHEPWTGQVSRAIGPWRGRLRGDLSSVEMGGRSYLNLGIAG